MKRKLLAIVGYGLIYWSIFAWMNYATYLEDLPERVNTLLTIAAIFAQPLIIVEIGSFLIFNLILHFSSAALAVLISRPRKPRSRAGIPLSLIPFVLIISMQLGWNSLALPNTRSAYMIEPITSQALWPFLFAALHVVFFYYLFSESYRHIKKIKINHFLIIGAILTASGVMISEATPSSIDQTLSPRTSNPDVILIGIDSLRPDFIPKLRREMMYKSSIGNFLDQSFVFTNSITPLARTFPSWMSILSGKYPFSHGAVDNLTNPSRVDRENIIPKYFQQTGYETIFATDERRFSNIDESYGFDIITGPKLGALDFILGSYSDFPALNLFLRTPIADKLFPYIALNRAAAHTYDPKKFIEKTLKTVALIPPEKDLFATLHLCLAHWPYTWAYSSPSQANEFSDSSLAGQYLDALVEIDRNFELLMQGLKAQGRLDNAIVVLFSDHGEGLNLKKDALTPSAGSSSNVLSIARNPGGHGSDVLSPAHHKVILAVWSSSPDFRPGSSDAPTSLIDIAPTLSELTGLWLSPTHGQSLAPFLRKEAEVDWSTRVRMWESGLRSNALLSPELDKRSILEEQLDKYDLLNGGRLGLSEAALNELKVQKQLAANLGNLVVAATFEGGEWHVALADWNTMTWHAIHFGSIESTNHRNLLNALCDYSDQHGSDFGTSAWCP